MTPEDVDLSTLDREPDVKRWAPIHAQVQEWVERYGDSDEERS
jgi:hypothetical protein